MGVSSSLQQFSKNNKVRLVVVEDRVLGLLAAIFSHINKVAQKPNETAQRTNRHKFHKVGINQILENLTTMMYVDDTELRVIRYCSH